MFMRLGIIVKRLSPLIFIKSKNPLRGFCCRSPEIYISPCFEIGEMNHDLIDIPNVLFHSEVNGFFWNLAQFIREPDEAASETMDFFFSRRNHLAGLPLR